MVVPGEHASVDALHGRAGRGAEPVAQQDAQAVVDQEGLRVVAALLERLHEDPVAALVVRSQLDEPSPAFLRPGQRGPPEAEAGRRKALESSDADELEALALVEPHAVLTLQERSAGDVVRDPGRPPGLRPLAGVDVGLRAVNGLERGLDVDERVRGQDELELRRPRSSSGPTPGTRYFLCLSRKKWSKENR